MKTKQSKFAVVAAIVLALLASVTLVAGCVAIPTITQSANPRRCQPVHRHRRALRHRLHRPQLHGPPQIHNLYRPMSRIA